MAFTATGAWIPDGNSGYGGSFNFTSTGAGANTQPYKAPAPQQPQYGATTAGSGHSMGIANGQYANPFEIQKAENAFRTQQRGLDAQKDMAQMGYDNQIAMQNNQISAQERQREAQMAALQSVMGNFNAQWGGGTMPVSQPQFTPIQMQSAPREARLQMPDNQAANAAAFARAKDQAGQTAQSALASLRGALGGRGLLGSGAEYRGTSNLAQKGMGQLGEVTRDQAITNAGLANQNAQANYQGDIAQRSQDMQQNNIAAQFNADQQMRAQEWQQRQQQQQQQMQYDMQRQMMEMALQALKY